MLFWLPLDTIAPALLSEDLSLGSCRAGRPQVHAGAAAEDAVPERRLHRRGELLQLKLLLLQLKLLSAFQDLCLMPARVLQLLDSYILSSRVCCLNQAACRLLYDIMPGVETDAIFQEKVRDASSSFGS